MKAPLQVSYAEKKSSEIIIIIIYNHFFQHQHHYYHYHFAASSSVRQPAKLFVGHAPREVTEQQLRTLFEPYGKIVEIFVMKDHDGAGKGDTSTNKNTITILSGSAFVKYEDIADARSAIAGLHEKYQMEVAFFFFT